jgi:tetratricopeptide (TPR) repeat protein
MTNFNVSVSPRIGRLVLSASLLFASAVPVVAVPQIGRPDDGPPATPNPGGGRKPPVVKKPTATRTPSGVLMPLGRTPNYYLEEGIKLLTKEDYASAQMFFEEGLKGKAKPDVAANLQQRKQEVLWFVSAGQFERDGNTADAIVYYDKILAADPANENARRRAAKQLKIQGDAAVKRDDWATAVSSLERSEQIVSAPATRASLVMALLGLAHKQAGNPGEARATYKRVLDIDANNAKALEEFRKLQVAEYVQLGEVALRAKNFTGAGKAFDDALAIDPNNAAAKRGKAMTAAELERDGAEAAYKKRDFRAARDAYSRIVAALPNDTVAAKRLEELNIRLAPASPLRGSMTYSLKVGSPFRIRLQKDQVTSNLLNSDNPIAPTVKVNGILPLQNTTFKLSKVSANAQARISVMPTAASGFAAEIVVDPKAGTSQEIQVVAEWSVPLKGTARWSEQVTPGKYTMYWQGPYFDVADPNGNMLSSLQESLPRQTVAVKLGKPDKAYSAKIVALPSAENDFTLVVELDVTKPTRAVFEINWTAK